MDFGFSAEQEQLRDTVRDFLAAKAPISYARAMTENAHGVSDDVWRQVSELGWLALAIPEEFGGIGLGWLDLAIVMESLGEVVFPGPFMSTTCLATPALLFAGNEQQKIRLLPEIATGAHRSTLAVAEQTASWSGSSISMPARRSGGVLLLSGEKLFVPDARTADSILVAVALDSGVGIVEVPATASGLTIEPMRTIDATRKLDAVRFDGVEVATSSLLGGRAVAADSFDALLDLSRTLLAAECCGAASRCLEMSVDYVQIREQFGRPIATFQALQHRLADMKVAVENTRSLIYYAAWSFDDAETDPSLAATMAKAFASEACMRVVADAIQVHGGIGFTWEHDLHLYFKRLKSNELMYDDATMCRERIASMLGL